MRIGRVQCLQAGFMIPTPIIGIRMVAPRQFAVTGFYRIEIGAAIQSQMVQRFPILTAQRAGRAGGACRPSPAQYAKRIFYTIRTTGKGIMGKGAGFAFPVIVGALRFP